MNVQSNGKKRSGTDFSKLIHSVESSAEISQLVDVPEELAVEWQSPPEELKEIEGAYAFFMHVVAPVQFNQNGNHKETVGSYLIATTSNPPEGEDKDLMFWATEALLAVVQILTSDKKAICCEVIGYLQDRDETVSEEDAGLLPIGKRFSLDVNHCTYFVFQPALSGPIIEDLCIAGPHVASKRAKNGGMSRGDSSSSSSISLVSGGSSSGSSSSGGTKDWRVDADGRKWLCSSKEWTDRLARLRFPLRLMHPELASRLFPNLNFSLADMFTIWDNVGHSPPTGALALCTQIPRTRAFVVVKDHTLFERAFLGQWRSRDPGHLCLAHFSENFAATMAKFERFNCSPDVRSLLAQLLKKLELFMAAYVDSEFKNTTLSLQEELEDVDGCFSSTGDLNNFYEVHGALSRFAMDLCAPRDKSDYFPEEKNLFGLKARNLLTKHLQRLITNHRKESSAYPHDLDYTPLGKWANMSKGATVTFAKTPSAGAVVPSGQAVCSYYLAQLLGVKTFKGPVVQCTSPACPNGPHNILLTQITKVEAYHALDYGPLTGNLKGRTRTAIDAYKKWKP
jgi:hypothetical protein